MRGRRALLTLLVGVTAWVTPAAAAPAQEPAGVVTLVHGVRGLVADVYLDGALVLETFQPERTTDPLQIPAGDHTVEVRSAGQAVASEPLLTATLSVVAGSNVSATVHVDADGAPALTAFTDDVQPTPAGQGRLAVRHVAAAGPLDVAVGGEPVASALANGTESVQSLAAATYPVTVTSGGEEVIPATDLPLAAGSLTAIYLIGAAADDSLTWLVASIPTTAVAPQVINSGTDGLAAPTPFPTAAVAALTILVVAAAWRARLACGDR
jgi:hypothetical protein